MSKGPGRYLGIWPLPGGTGRYLHSLLRILRFVAEREPREEELARWMIDEFHLRAEELTGTEAVFGYMRVVKQLGLIERAGERYRLTSRGEEILLVGSRAELCRRVYEILNERYAGFDFLLSTLSEREPLSLNELHELLRREVNAEWRSRNQTLYRLGWLASVGAVTREGDGYRLTEFGRELVGLAPPQEERGMEGVEWGSIRERILRTQHETTRPEEFEEAVAKAFELLGFDMEVLGAPGEPDAVLRAPWLGGGFSAVLDAKTAEEGGHVSESRVNPWALRDFRRRYGADAALVVGPRFARGRLQRVAREEGIVLLETSTLASILELAAKGPIGPGDLIPIIAESGGTVTQSDLSPLEEKASRFARLTSLAAEACRQIWDLQREGERTRVSDLYWALGREYEEGEIEVALDFLGKLGIVRREENGDYTLLVDPRWIPYYLERAARVMRGR